MSNLDNQLKNLLFILAQENLKSSQSSSSNSQGINNTNFSGNGMGYSLPNSLNLLNGLNGMNIQGGINLSTALQYQELMRNVQIYELLKKQSNLGVSTHGMAPLDQIIPDQKIWEISNNLAPSTNISENRIKIEEKFDHDIHQALSIKKIEESKNSDPSRSLHEKDFYSNDFEICRTPLKNEESSIKKIKCQFMTQKDDFPQEKPKYFKCRHCDKIFPKESNLVDHLRTHTGEKPFKCSFENCGKSFSQLGNLKKHESVHFGEKAFYCEFDGCGKGFSAMYNLKIHQRSHSGEKPYKCTVEGCGRDFYDKGNLKYHEKTSHSYELKSNPFSCDHIGCNLKFKTKKQKLIHHHNLEPECKEEKQAIIKTLALFKKYTLSFVKNDPEKFKNDKDYLELKASYEELERKLLDPDFFFLSLGDNFEDIPN